MTWVRFQEVKLYGEKSVKCAGGCGRRLRRQRTFWQTLNPFNKGANGVPKTVDEIHAELRVQKQAWQAEGETCIHCSGSSSGGVR